MIIFTQTKKQMQTQVLLFGIVADLVGESSINLELKMDGTVSDFKKKLTEAYPQLQNYTTYAIALNEAYALDDTIVKDNDVIAIIPPVSGG